METKLVYEIFRDDNPETETIRCFIFGSLISSENNETEEERLRNIGTLEKIRDAIKGVPEAVNAYRRCLECIDILKKNT